MKRIGKPMHGAAWAWRRSASALGLLAAGGVPDSSKVDRIPAVSPLSGPFWSLVVPALLFAVALGSTWLLYRRFSRR